MTLIASDQDAPQLFEKSNANFVMPPPVAIAAPRDAKSPDYTVSI